MRPLLLSALIVSISIGPTQAQEFLPIVKEGAVWYQTEGWGAGGETEWYNYLYEIEGDTLIGLQAYKKLYRYINYDTIHSFNKISIGAIREDSGRVFFHEFYDTNDDEFEWCLHAFNHSGFWTDSVIDFSSEVLIYDFNLTVGDTFYVYEVWSVDSVILADGISRKQMVLRPFNWTVGVGGDMVWTEGVGSDQGLLEVGCMVFENGYSLTCYSDSAVHYPDPCLSINMSTNNFDNEVDWSLTPNPATTSIRIEIQNSERSEVVIHNMFGEAVLRTRVSGNQQVEVLGLPAGLYSATLIQNGQSVGSQRLVILR